MRNRTNRGITAIEAAQRLGVGLQYVYSLLWSRKLAGQKIGKRWLISEDAVAARLNKKDE